MALIPHPVPDLHPHPVPETSVGGVSARGAGVATDGVRVGGVSARGAGVAADGVLSGVRFPPLIVTPGERNGSVL